MDLSDFRDLLYTAQSGLIKRPFAIRYPKASAEYIGVDEVFTMLEIGKGRKIRSGTDVAVLSLGPVGMEVKAACDELEKEGIAAAHYDLRFFKPLDEEMLHEVFSNFKAVITVEDGCVAGGAGSAVLEFMTDHHYHAVLKRLGLPDEFAVQGTQNELHELYGYDKKAIIAAVKHITEQTCELLLKNRSSVISV